MKLSRPLITLDLEATGTWIEKDKIVEVGMIRSMPDGSRLDYVKRVNPGISIPEVVSKIIGIKDEDVKDAPSFRDLAQEILDFIGDADIAGFNVERFDLPLLEREISDAGLIFEWKSRTMYDAQKVFHIHEKRDLTAAYQFYCGKELHNAHTALGDAEATLEIIRQQVGRYGKGDDNVESLQDFDYERSSSFYDKDRRFCWWNGELYPMFGKHAKRASLKEMVKKDRRYLEWMLSKDFSPEVQQLIADALNGKFPKQQSGTKSEK
ncbi:3'-5' exonuclease [Candidatus Omnitrophota bacterium]